MISDKDEANKFIIRSMVTSTGSLLLPL